GRQIECPAGLEQVQRKLSIEEARTSGGVSEEFCRRREANGTFVKHGPYTLWGPNGEAFEQGCFVDGQRDGKWISINTSQVVEHFYDKGTIVPAKGEVVGEPEWLVIDFAAANRQAYRVWCTFGS